MSHEQEIRGMVIKNGDYVRPESHSMASDDVEDVSGGGKEDCAAGLYADCTSGRNLWQGGVGTTTDTSKFGEQAPSKSS